MKVLVEGGRNQDSNLNAALRLSRAHAGVRARVPARRAASRKGETRGPRVDRAAAPDDERDPAGGGQRARRGAERSVPALVLELERALDRDRAQHARQGRTRTTPTIRPMVRWLMAARKDGRWGNTQENAYAMEALVDYYRKYESAVPDFSAVVTLGDEELAREQFHGRIDRVATQTDVPMAQVLAKAQPGHDAAADVHTRGQRHALLHGALPLRRRRAVPGGTRQRLPHRAHVRAVRRERHRPAATTFKAGDLIRVTLTFATDEGAALRRGHRSAARRLRAGRVVVRDDGRARWPSQQDDQGEATRRLDSRGGSAAASITSSATTIASSSSPRGSAKAPRVHLHRPRDDRRDVPDRAGARRGDVRAGGVRADGDER